MSPVGSPCARDQARKRQPSTESFSSDIVANKMRARAAKRSTSAVDELDRRRGRTVFWGGRCFVSLDTNFCCIAPGELVARSRAGRDARTRKLDASRGAVYVRARRHAPRSRSLLGWSALRVVRHELLLCVSLLANRWLDRARGQRRSHTEARRESWCSVCASAAPRWTSAKSVCQSISARGAPTPPSPALGLALQPHLVWLWHVLCVHRHGADALLECK